MNNEIIKIIAIDDNEAFCDAMLFVCDLISYVDCITYHNAASFLANYHHYKNGILLIDLLMPGMDGIALLEELKKRKNKMYTVIMSGHADKATAAKAKALGANEFLPKPFDVEKFLNRMQSMLSLK